MALWTELCQKEQRIVVLLGNWLSPHLSNEEEEIRPPVCKSAGNSFELPQVNTVQVLYNLLYLPACPSARRRDPRA